MGSIESIKTDNSIIDFNSTFSTNNGSFNDGSSVEVVNNSGASDNIVVDDYDFNTDVNNNDVSFLEMITPEVSLEVESPDTIDADVLTLNNGDGGNDSIGPFSFLDENGNIYTIKKADLIKNNVYYYTLVDGEGNESTVIGQMNGNKMTLADKFGYSSDDKFVLEYLDGGFEYFDADGTSLYAYRNGNLMYDDYVVSLEGATDVFNFTKESGKDFFYVLDMYVLCSKNGMALKYGTISRKDGWYSNSWDYEGFYATCDSKSGYSFIVALEKVDKLSDDNLTGQGYPSSKGEPIAVPRKYSDFGDDLERYIEGCSQYIKTNDEFFSENATDCFKERVFDISIKNNEGKPVITIVDYKEKGEVTWAGLSVNGDDGRGTAINGSRIFGKYNPEDGKDITVDSKCFGTLIHELGHSFDMDFSRDDLSDQRFAKQDTWQNVGRQFLDYMYTVGKDPNTDHVVVNIGSDAITRITYSNYLYKKGWTKDKVWDFLDYEFFTECNRVYYQSPESLQNVPIDYTDSVTNVHYDNLFDFFDALNHGKIVGEEVKESGVDLSFTPNSSQGSISDSSSSSSSNDGPRVKWNFTNTENSNDSVTFTPNSSQGSTSDSSSNDGPRVNLNPTTSEGFSETVTFTPNSSQGSTSDSSSSSSSNDGPRVNLNPTTSEGFNENVTFTPNSSQGSTSDNSRN